MTQYTQWKCFVHTYVKFIRVLLQQEKFYVSFLQELWNQKQFFKYIITYVPDQDLISAWLLQGA